MNRQDWNEREEEIVKASFDVEKTVEVFRKNGLTKTADEYLLGAGECVARITDALSKAYKSGQADRDAVWRKRFAENDAYGLGYKSGVEDAAKVAEYHDFHSFEDPNIAVPVEIRQLADEKKG